jgi:hypothetical protein
MKNTGKINKKEVWDSRELGASEEHVRRAGIDREKALDERLGLQVISIRLQKHLIDDLKKLAKEDGIGYQPYIRQVLMQHMRYKEKDKRTKSEEVFPKIISK